MITAYCDGSCIKDNRGGWASIILVDKQEIVLFNGKTNTTNNRMEILAVIGTLEYFKEPISIKIYSDSQYVVNSINEGWIYKWIQDPNTDKKNIDLWAKLIELLKFHNVTIQWVKGHNLNKYNEMADMYARTAANSLNLEEDV